jgi:hypothetical protein
MDLLTKQEQELRAEAALLLEAADLLHEVSTGKKVTTEVNVVKPKRKYRRRKPIEVAREAAKRHGVNPDAVQPAEGGGLKIDLGTATGLEESDLKDSDLVHASSEGNGRRRIA